jgi:hypothetical protein
MAIHQVDSHGRFGVRDMEVEECGSTSQGMALRHWGGPCRGPGQVESLPDLNLNLPTISGFFMQNSTLVS